MVPALEEVLVLTLEVLVVTVAVLQVVTVRPLQVVVLLLSAPAVTLIVMIQVLPTLRLPKLQETVVEDAVYVQLPTVGDEET
jgi:hypothetical protein